MTHDQSETEKERGKRAALELKCESESTRLTRMLSDILTREYTRLRCEERLSDADACSIIADAYSVTMHTWGSLSWDINARAERMRSEGGERA